MRTTTMVIGLIAAIFLLLGGCSGYVFGSVAESIDETFDIESESDGASSSEVSMAGSFAMLVALFLFLAAGLARVALRTSFVLLVLGIPMLIGVLSIDAVSLFAVTYYLALLLTGTGAVLMFLEWRRQPDQKLLR